MVSPYVRRAVRVAFIDVLGVMWMPACDAAQIVKLSDHDLQNIGEFTRENVEDWLSTHSGDFRCVKDFRAMCGNVTIDWGSEENEARFIDCMGGEDDL